MTAIKLPAGHALDWYTRIGIERDDVKVVAKSPRTVTLDLSDRALADLISDAIYYSEEMDASNTEDKDYRGMARTCLRALDKKGVTWQRRLGTFMVTITERPA